MLTLCNGSSGEMSQSPDTAKFELDATTST